MQIVTKNVGFVILVSGKCTLRQKILLETRVTCHNDKRVNTAGCYNNDKCMYLVTELQNT